MHNLLRCRRGSAAFATVVALVPLIGVVALGGEAGSWYVTKQHAQNAADSAAMSGALIRSRFRRPPFLRFLTHKRTTIAVGNLRPRTRSATRAIPPIPAPNVLRFRQEPRGQYRSIADRCQLDELGDWHCVRAIVSQQQPAYLAKVLGLSTVNIPAHSHCPSSRIPKELCILGLEPVPSVQGSATYTQLAVAAQTEMVAG